MFCLIIVISMYKPSKKKVARYNTREREREREERGGKTSIVTSCWSRCNRTSTCKDHSLIDSHNHLKCRCLQHTGLRTPEQQWWKKKIKWPIGREFNRIRTPKISVVASIYNVQPILPDWRLSMPLRQRNCQFVHSCHSNNRQRHHSRCKVFRQCCLGKHGRRFAEALCRIYKLRV